MENILFPGLLGEKICVMVTAIMSARARHDHGCTGPYGIFS